MSRVLVAGLGSVGLRIAVNLAKLGFDVVGVDSSSERARWAESLGLRSILADPTSSVSLRRAVRGADIAVLALPGSISAKALQALLSLGADVIDASTSYGRPGWLLEYSKKNDRRVILNMGVAPGLSNVVVANIVEKLGLSDIRVFVGSIPLSKDDPLGISIGGSGGDVISRYKRPARAILDWEVARLDPLGDEHSGIIEVEGLGPLEYFPADSLGGLVDRYRRRVRNLVSYSLARPGHRSVIKLVDRLGLLSSSMIRVRGCPVAPVEVLEHLLERIQCCVERDLMILRVEASSGDRGIVYGLKVEGDGNWHAESIVSGAFIPIIVKMMAEGELDLDSGVYHPEDLVGRGLSLDRLSSGLGDFNVNLNTSPP